MDCAAAKLQSSSNSIARLGRVKGILDPFDVGFAQSVEQNSVEAAGAFPLAGKKMPRSQYDASPLSGGNAGSRTTKSRMLAQANLDEDQRTLITANQVDFTAPHAPVALHYAQALPPQKSRSKRFGLGASHQLVVVSILLYLHGAVEGWTMNP